MLEKMKIAEIQEELKKRMEPIYGFKSVMLAWMKEELNKESPLHRDSTTNTVNKSISANDTTGVYSIAEDSWGKVLDTSTIVEDPTNPTLNHRTRRKL